MRRNGHDGTGAVADQNVVGHPDRNLFAVDGVDRIRTGEHARLFLGQFCAIQVALQRRCATIFNDLGPLFIRRQSVDKRMFRSDHHVCGTVQRVRSSRVDSQHIIAGFRRPTAFRSCCFPVLNSGTGGACGIRIADEEINFGTGTATDPVPLQQLDRFGPIQVVQLIGQSVCVRRDPQHPLLQSDSFDRVTASFAFAVNDFFVRQHGSQGRAPIYGSFRYVRQPMLVLITSDRFVTGTCDVVGNWQFCNRSAFADASLPVLSRPFVFSVVPGVEQLQKDPLCPAVILRVSRG